jgi:hypothetical protein
VTIIKIEKRADPYARIDNKTINDRNLSLKARGLLIYLLSKPPNWHVVFKHLVAEFPDGRYAIRAALNELQEYGYANLNRPRDDRGRITGSTWLIYERPITDMLVFPLSVKSDSRRNPVLGKIRTSEKSATTNEIASKSSTNKRTSTKLLAPNGEPVLLDELRAILGVAEMKKNGGMWRKRIRGGAAERRALRNTIEDYKLRTPDQRCEIVNLPAWFTDRYTRNLVKVNAPRNGTSSNLPGE